MNIAYFDCFGGTGGDMIVEATDPGAPGRRTRPAPRGHRPETLLRQQDRARQAYLGNPRQPRRHLHPTRPKPRRTPPPQPPPPQSLSGTLNTYFELPDASIFTIT